MFPNQSLSPAHEKFHLHNLINKATDEIISVLDDFETKLKSYISHSPHKDNMIGAEGYPHHQSPPPMSRHNLTKSWNPQPKLTDAEKYQGEISTSRCKNEYSCDKNSVGLNAVQGEHPNTELFESVYNGGHQEKSNLSSLNTKLGSKSSATMNYKMKHPDSTGSTLNLDRYQRNQVHKPALDNLDEQSRHAYVGVGNRKSSLMNTRGFLNDGGSALPTYTAREDNFSAAVNHSRVWHKGKKGFVPPKTAPVAKTRKGIALYAGRVNHEGNIIPATVSPKEGLACYSWNDKVFCTRDFEIVEIHHFAWKDEDEDDAHEKVRAFPIGQTADGKPLYLGRVYLEGMGPWVGRVHRDEKHIFIAFRGNELRIPQPYEVLVTY